MTSGLTKGYVPATPPSRFVICVVCVRNSSHVARPARDITARVADSSRTEVGDLARVVVGEEDVVRLEIAVLDAVLVEVLHAARDLPAPGQLLAAADDGEVGRVVEARAQRAARHVLHDKREVVRVRREDAEDLDDERRPQLAHDAQLCRKPAHHLDALNLRQPEQPHALHRDALVVVLASVDLRLAAAGEWQAVHPVELDLVLVQQVTLASLLLVLALAAVEALPHESHELLELEKQLTLGDARSACDGRRRHVIAGELQGGRARGHVQLVGERLGATTHRRLESVRQLRLDERREPTVVRKLVRHAELVEAGDDVRVEGRNRFAVGESFPLAAEPALVPKRLDHLMELDELGVQAPHVLLDERLRSIFLQLRRVLDEDREHLDRVGDAHTRRLDVVRLRLHGVARP
mmetsp:Transcript_8970/g.37051  ORF Transcript_8970/g.37051 Transcript_8970/m.37051 type:complete len:408 (-) Transcript_8970:283-1506(-)